MNISVKLPQAETRYDIIIEKGAMNRAAEYCSSRAVIVTDENVNTLYGDALECILATQCRVSRIVLPAGEATKNLNTIAQLYDAFSKAQLDRSGVIFALGGGVVGDTAGFAAATYMRGVPLVQVPTTVLAQVDSSVGGKTGVNIPQGKNLAGAFYQPKSVLIDTNTVSTLPERELAGGMAEVIKYGFIADKSLLDSLGKIADLHTAAADESIISCCCRIKADIVMQDEKDFGLRMLLNFGHTYAHAIESLYNYEKYIHGEAVAIGMSAMAAVGEALEITPVGIRESIDSLLNVYRLPMRDEATPKQVFDHMITDKKRSSESISIVLPVALGKCEIFKVSLERLFTAMEEAL